MHPKLALRSAVLCWVSAMMVLFVVDQVRNYSIVTELHGFVQLLRERFGCDLDHHGCVPARKSSSRDILVDVRMTDGSLPPLLRKELPAVCFGLRASCWNTSRHRTLSP